MRHYLHGDLIEGESDLYYCRCCDLLKDQAHFKEHNTPDPSYPRAKHPKNITRYRREVEKWMHWKRNGVLESTGYSRPKTPPNLFAAEARSLWKSLPKV
jgi:hypothetical protein